MLFEEVKLLPADPESSDAFGTSVAVNADLAVVGSPRDDDHGSSSGSAYVYVRGAGAAGGWEQVAKLTASDAAADARFGTSVAVSGDTAVVGAPGPIFGGLVGAAYVFQRDHQGAGAWGEVVKLTVADGAPDNYFGFAVTLDGDTALVGAHGDGEAGLGAGAVYVFERDAGGADLWGQVDKITASDASYGASFGWSVSLDLDTAVVGAEMESGVAWAAGAAYVLGRDHGGPGSWGEIRKLLASDAAENDRFGSAVAISGDHAVVGAYATDGAGVNSGSGYIFRRDQGGADSWGEVASITASDPAGGDDFGGAVAISGEVVVVGALGNDEGGNGAGAAYLFERDHGGADAWGETQKITASDAANGDHLGSSVAIHSRIVLVGCPHDFDGGVLSGSAWVLTEAGLIFADGFDSGDTSRWGATVP